MRHMQTNFTALLVAVILGFICLGPDGSSAADSRCTLQVETTDVVLNLSPSSDYCDQSSVTVFAVKKGSCSNNGNRCSNTHNRYSEKLNEQLCVAKTNDTITGTTTVTGPGCQKTVTYRFTNITECKCELVAEVSLI